MRTENKKKTKHGKNIFRLILSQKKYYLRAVVCSLFSIFISFLSPIVLAELIDHYLGNAPSKLPSSVNHLLGGEAFIANNLWLFGAAILLLNLVKGSFSYIKDLSSAKASENIALTLRQRLYRHIQHLSFGYHVKAETGDLMQRCTSDVDSVRRFLSVQVLSIFNSIFMITAALILMLPISIKVTLLAFLPIPLFILFCFFFFKVIIKAYTTSEEAEAKLSAVLQENLTGVRVVRAFGQQKSETEKYSRANDKFFGESLRAIKLESAYWSSGDLFSAIQMFIITLVCILEAISGNMTTGTMVLLTSYSGMLVGPTRQLGRVLSQGGRALVANERICEILSSETEQLSGDKTPSLKGDIVFDHVSFSYDKTRKVLDDISFRVKEGQTVAILAGTGEGKSTLVHLLQRLYPLSGGNIYIGSHNLNDIEPKHLRKKVGLILQEPFLFSKTILDNVNITQTEKNMQKIEESCLDASALSFIKESDKGFDTMVGEKGVTLSGGQKQRVAIARTLLGDHDILIFDDSLSAVDTKTDLEIRNALKKRRKNVTSFIISHRITTLKDADLILVLKGGRLIQSGTHESLLLEDGLYKKIFEIQNAV